MCVCVRVTVCVCVCVCVIRFYSGFYLHMEISYQPNLVESFFPLSGLMLNSSVYSSLFEFIMNALHICFYVK